MEKIANVLLIDDHPIVGEGVAFFLNLDPHFHVIGTADDATEGLKLLNQLHPNVVVLDISMPKMNGLEAISLYREADPAIKIVIFSAHTEEKFVYQSLFAGAQGYVVKGSPPNELKQAITFVLQGGYWLSPEFSPRIVEKYLQSQQSEGSERHSLATLSDREKQVFRLMVAGKQTEEIGNLLFISINTVAKHRNSIMKKLGVTNMVELTRFAIRNGIIEA